MAVLVITNREDVTSDLVVARLQELGSKVFRLNTDELCDASSFAVEIRAGRVCGNLATQHHGIDLSEVGAVYYRRPMPRRLPHLDPGEREFVQRESLLFVRWLSALLTDRYWLSAPEVIRRADCKFAQLVEAERAGLATPDTLCTNRKKEILGLLEEAGGALVTKPLGPGYIEGSPRRIFYTSRLDESLVRRSAVEAAPCLVQPVIAKALEVRATVVGDEIFAAEIHSQENMATALDWRRYPATPVTHRAHKLPGKTAEACRALVRSFGLEFAAIDLILTPAGGYVFLDLNPNGQWTWIEQLTGLPIREAIVSLLRGHD